MTRTSTPDAGSLNRVEMVPSSQSITFSRSVSDSTSSALCGSSRRMTSPPSPVPVPPTEVASR